MAAAAKFAQPIPIFLAYLVPLDVDVTGNITAKFVKFGVNLTFFAPWLPWQIGIGLANFAAVAMETKKGRFKKKLDSFHQAS
jgi:hypothetical protein